MSQQVPGSHRAFTAFWQQNNLLRTVFAHSFDRGCATTCCLMVAPSSISPAVPVPVPVCVPVPVPVCCACVCACVQAQSRVKDQRKKAFDKAQRKALADAAAALQAATAAAATNGADKKQPGAAEAVTAQDVAGAVTSSSSGSKESKPAAAAAAAAAGGVSSKPSVGKAELEARVAYLQEAHKNYDDPGTAGGGGLQRTTMDWVQGCMLCAVAVQLMTTGRASLSQASIMQCSIAGSGGPSPHSKPWPTRLKWAGPVSLSRRRLGPPY